MYGRLEPKGSPSAPSLPTPGMADETDQAGTDQDYRRRLRDLDNGDIVGIHQRGAFGDTRPGSNHRIHADEAFPPVAISWDDVARQAYATYRGSWKGDPTDREL